ncbi:MAG: transglutaminase domain-containing protein [Dysgonamonadaceae bacterium]|jgi:transglutaminase-like putative cysteine protease|nr:transglutaminase domain-containing protein [Dysgonamonadaceae bacterium]
MKKTVFIFSFTLAMLLFFSCKEEHFLKDETYRNKVHEQFEKRKTEVANRHDALFSVFKKENLSLKQIEALEFLYAYMPLCDLADYDGQFFLNQVNIALKTRDYFSWGKTIPDDIFRHYVLVYRINNEYLDSARMVFFEELKDRVKNLSMYEAALEVNHWCHEKVTYRGTDSRTSGPLALVCTSWGRCGEESTFTATALRAVGIPARQCYTPRWVHTDDNHAWIEVWIDGEWHYLGACEPEPELDVAWFTGPAKRAMMVHTIAFGLYNGSEEKNVETPLYSKINLLENYAETRTVKVRIIDENDKPVEGAKVRFQVYNYAELYSIVEKDTDADGFASIISGKGDLMIWASKENIYGYQKSTPNDELTTVKLDRRAGIAYRENFVMNVPKEQPVKELSSEKIKANIARLASEDSIRNAYMNTFINEEQAFLLAEKNNLNKDEVWKYLSRSQGNWKEISQFIVDEKENPLLFPYLATLTEKDLRDTPAKYLSSYLLNKEDIALGISQDVFVPYVLSPRIENELIQLRTELFPVTPNVESFIKFIDKNIKISDEDNYYNCRISPRGVSELQMADIRSRNISFVAMCRYWSIPARIEAATGKPQYLENDVWKDAVFESDKSSVAANLPKAKLKIQNAASNIVKPGYYTHYTIACFKDGAFQTLDFENDITVSKFPYTLELDEGYYRLMVGSRANDGSVFVNAEYFELKGNTLNVLEVKMPEVEGKLLVKGIVDMNFIANLNDQSKATLKELSKGKGLILCFLDPGKEPSKHILQDFPAVQQSLDEWGGGVLFLIPDDKVVQSFNASTFKNLPANTRWGIDSHRPLLQSVAGALQIDFHDNFPLTVYLSRNGGILYSSVGYHIGVGEDMLKIIKLEKKYDNK